MKPIHFLYLSTIQHLNKRLVPRVSNLQVSIAFSSPHMRESSSPRRAFIAKKMFNFILFYLDDAFTFYVYIFFRPKQHGYFKHFRLLQVLRRVQNFTNTFLTCMRRKWCIINYVKKYTCYPFHRYLQCDLQVAKLYFWLDRKKIQPSDDTILKKVHLTILGHYSLKGQVDELWVYSCRLPLRLSPYFASNIKWI